MPDGADGGGCPSRRDPGELSIAALDGGERPVTPILEWLLDSPEPSIVWKTRVEVLGEVPDPDLGEAIRQSPRVQALRAGVPTGNVYNKWHGAHWVLASLADLGYPCGDDALIPLRERVLVTWLAPSYFTHFEAGSQRTAYNGEGVPLTHGRFRRCASQQGNALWSLHRLGLADGRCQQLVERLLHWQWPDGGWNCDKNPAADTSSFMETLLPMRGLAAHAAATGDPMALDGALRAAEVFLSRRLFRRRRGGEVIHPEFLALHHPLYWHYDILGGLKGLAELGMLGDFRCAEALDLLEEKRLPDGGWPAEKQYYSVSREPASGSEAVDWGGTGKKKVNPWVTAAALAILTAAGRM